MHNNYFFRKVLDRGATTPAYRSRSAFGIMLGLKRFARR
jgi:hypothetical protein